MFTREAKSALASSPSSSSTPCPSSTKPYHVLSIAERSDSKQRLEIIGAMNDRLQSRLVASGAMRGIGKCATLLTGSISLVSAVGVLYNEFGKDTQDSATRLTFISACAFGSVLWSGLVIGAALGGVIGTKTALDLIQETDSSLGDSLPVIAEGLKQGAIIGSKAALQGTLSIFY